ncbi:RBM7 protein, partial [Halcyon senegalensis]|nr:RBM7 protein [Halcyon senegalensis]
MGAAAAEADRTLFVGNLDPKVTEELIFELFHQAGPVIKVKIPKDRDGRPKQFAFVNFKHEESVPYGLSLLNGIKLYGRPIKIQFRSGSSHASQDGNPSCSPRRGASASPSATPHPASACGRYECRQCPLEVQSGRQRTRTLRPHPPFGGTYEQPGFAPPGFPPPPHAFHPASAPPAPRRPEPPASRKGRLSAHPYHPDGRHFGREPRFGERGLDYGRAKRDEHGFDERGHHDAEHHYRGSREELAYDDRHRDGWSHDYDYRRESYREGRWHPSRH